MVASPANQISALITGLDTSFFQNPLALNSARANPTPNMWHGGTRRPDRPLFAHCAAPIVSIARLQLRAQRD
jgi:hypothetical protein